jgi:hypothetical protein
MKKSIIIILIGFLLTVNFACKKNFMDRFPLDKITDANYWQTPVDLKTYSNQFYPTLLDPNFFWSIDNMSDNQAPSNIASFIWNQYVVPSSGGGWGKSDWAAIRSCNYFLKQYHSVQGDSTSINTYVAEIKFFKAFFYFEKVRKFGDVPWLNDVLQTNSEQLVGPRDSRMLVMDSIIKNLDFAVLNLPDESNEDRLTKDAALAFKTRVCLYEATYRKYHNLGDYDSMLKEAVSTAEVLINSGKYALYSTGNPSTDYYNLFSLDELRGNLEGIMVQYYALDILMHNRNRILSEPQTGFTKDFAKAYLCKDGKPISVSPLYKGDAQFTDEFIDRDPRMKQSIYTPDRPFLISSSGTISYQPVPEFNTSRCNTGYRIIKFFSPFEKDMQQGRSVKPTFIFRYAEVLLNYAEAEAELGECTQQVLDRSINPLRDRVGMPHLTVDVGFVDPEWPNWEVPITPLINEIRRERRIELSAEGFRFDDLRRWKAGKLLETPQTYLGARDPSMNSYRILYPGFIRSWNDKLYLYPLPTTDLTLNPQLTQNPDW